jgi:hypothetical protein
MSTEAWDGGLADLQRPFPANVIGKLPKGNTQLDFVGHAAVTKRLLLVDPQWSWEPFATDEHGLPAYDRAGNLWIRLTVCGVTRIGVGDGPDPKQRIGDALRNAAMRFGVALDLWTKNELESTDPNGGDAAATPQRQDRPAQEKRAERGKVPTDVDPWANVEVARPPVVTDPKWLTDISQRIAMCDSIPILKGLWAEVSAETKAGKVADGDAADLKKLMEEMSADLSKTATVQAS